MSPVLAFFQIWGTALIGCTLAAICLLFVGRFIVPGLLLEHELRRVIAALQALGKDQPTNERPARCAEILAAPGLRHLWREYAQTLHRHERPNQPADARATTMAGIYFTEQAVVDTPLKTGFYKHLPGILTGIGIIGTFSGLIAGLARFEVSSEANAVRASLESLIRSVGHAFEISALAITLAMLFTWIEKSQTTRLYRAVEQLGQAIDSLFDAGVGEEYLARLVRASEAAAMQGAQLRQALVGELRQSLQGLLAEQQASAQQQQAALANSVAQVVGQTLQRTLGEPLTRMTAAVEALNAQQGATLGSAMESTLERFSRHLDENLGSRHEDIDRLLQHTGQTLNQIVGELGRLTARLESSGHGAIHQASGQLQQAGVQVDRAGESLAAVSREMAEAARAMNAAAQTASQAMSEQGRYQDSIARMVADLRTTVDTARRDASLTSELVGRLEQAAQTLATAEQRADGYLQAVNGVLGEAHQAFAEQVEQTLGRGNQQFQRSVVSAVEALEGAIEELSDALNGERTAR